MTTSADKRTLVLLRHAKAAQGQGIPDHDRELAQRGQRDAGAVGQWLSDPSRAVTIDLALCSTSERTRQTLEGVSAGGAEPKETRFDQRIYSAGAATLLTVLHEVPDSVNTVLVVGHAPGIPTLAMALAHEGAGSAVASDRLSQGFPTCGLAILGYVGHWAALAAQTADLHEFVVPRG